MGTNVFQQRKSIVMLPVDQVIDADAQPTVDARRSQQHKYGCHQRNADGGSKNNGERGTQQIKVTPEWLHPPW